MSTPSVSSSSSADVHLAQQLGVVGARLVEPEHRRRAGLTCARHGEPDPVLDRGVLGLAHAPDVARVDLVLHQRRALVVDDPNGARRGDLERLVVRPVLLGGLGHQADVGRGAHRRRVKRSVLAAVVDGLAIELRVGVIRDHELRVLELAVRVPHLPGRADRRRHRRVDDHVAGNVQAGDPTVGVDHRQPRPVGVRRLDRGFDRGALIVGQRLDRLQAARRGRRWGRRPRTSAPRRAPRTRARNTPAPRGRR